MNFIFKNECRKRIASLMAMVSLSNTFLPSLYAVEPNLKKLTLR